MTGMWRAWARGWRVIVPLIVVVAVIQSATVLGNPEPAPDLLFSLLTAASLVVTIGAVAIAAEAALAGVDGRRMSAPGGRLVLWSAAIVLGVTVVAVLLAVVTPLAIVLALVLLPAVADGQRNPLHGLVVFTRRPGRAVVFTLVALLVIALSWVVALLLGFFVTGPLAAGVTWLWFGLVSTLLLCGATSLYRRASPRQ
jgi:hypothetical protein